MNREDARRLLDRIGVLKHACDLDLLVFFARHPRTLLTSEQLAAWVGYELKRVAESLEMLLDAGLLTRIQNPPHVARLYIFVTEDFGDDRVPTLLKLASTRAGRLALKEELSRRAATNQNGRVRHAAGRAPAVTRPRPFVVPRRSDKTSGSNVG